MAPRTLGNVFKSPSGMGAVTEKGRLFLLPFEAKVRIRSPDKIPKQNRAR